jgi:hypothetical protein
MDNKQSRFSQELIERAIRYFEGKSGKHISEDTAIEYLISLGSLYESFIELTACSNKKKDNKDKKV